MVRMINEKMRCHLSQVIQYKSIFQEEDFWSHNKNENFNTSMACNFKFE